MRAQHAQGLLVLAVLACCGSRSEANSLMELARCHLCKSKPPAGPISDCCQECDAATVDEANGLHVLPILDELAKTAPVRYFQVDLWRPCSFWPEDGMCQRESCAVCECPPDDLPPALQLGAAPAAGEGCGSSVSASSPPGSWAAQADALSRVTLETGPGPAGGGVEGWSLPTGEEERRQWAVADAQSDSLAYVDLLSNPEGFTGYSGPASRRIWASLYEENCFRGSDGGEEGLCLEERAFVRLLSGLHASISTHLARDALQGRPHTALWVERVGAWPQRLRNLYFAYLVVLRAVHKAADRLLAPGVLASGIEREDARAAELLRRLVGREGETPASLHTVSRAFDESQMFRVRREEVVEACPAVLSGGLRDMQDLTRRFREAAVRKEALRDEFRGKFRNISRIMDCVGCEKCRMWGKLQFLGLGTAMKVLFDDADGDDAPLTRNEAVALVNVLHRLSISVGEVTAMRDREAGAAAARIGGWLAAVVGLGLAAASAVALVLRLRHTATAARGHAEAAAASAEATAKALAGKRAPSAAPRPKLE